MTEIKMYKVKDFEHFKENFADYGFSIDTRYSYPKRVIREIDPEKHIKICIDKQVINVWTQRDVNNQGEIWVEVTKGKNRGYGTCNIDSVKPFIEDLIEKGVVALNE